MKVVYKYKFLNVPYLAKIEFVGLGEMNSIRKVPVKYMYDVVSEDEWFTA